jgi:hypothetical protein
MIVEKMAKSIILVFETHYCEPHVYRVQFFKDSAFWSSQINKQFTDNLTGTHPQISTKIRIILVNFMSKFWSGKLCEKGSDSAQFMFCLIYKVQEIDPMDMGAKAGFTRGKISADICPEN